MLLTCLGPDAMEIHEGFRYEAGEDREKIETVIAKFDRYFMSETNEAYESYRFNKCEQAEGENIETYITRLRQLAKGCNYGDLTDRMLRDRIVAGIREDELRKKLLEERELTLKMAIDKCKIHESSNKQLQGMGHEDVHFVKSKYKNSDAKQKHGYKKKEGAKNFEGKNFEGKGKGFKKQCTYCLGKHVWGKDKCPGFGHQCSICGRKNHLEKACFQSKDSKKRVHACEMNESESEDEYFVLNVNDKSNSDSANAIYANMMIHDKTVSFQLDSGATTNCMSLDEYVRITDDKKKKNLTKTEKKLTMYNGSEVRPLGEIILDVTNPKNDNTYKVRFYILEGKFRPLLGFRAVRHMNLLNLLNC